MRHLLTPCALLALAAAVNAQSPPWIPRITGGQVTVIGQHLFPFTAPYSGSKSLLDSGDTKTTATYGVYLGSRVSSVLQLYLDLEMARGAGVSNATGLAGVTNGDVIRQGTANLSKGPYVARALVRLRIPLGPARDTVGRDIDQLAGVEPAVRLEIEAGKLAASDAFDLNRYANSTRTQFLDWGLFQNSAWDFAADTRGYTWGAVIAWVHPRWTARLGSFLMPTMANGNTFDTSYPRARGDNVELSVQPDASGTVLRFLAYENHARMGSYAEALAHARAVDSVPDIVADDRPGRTKVGLGVNVERPLADSGETGAFLRLGWSDGRNEDFAFTEVDRHASIGVQVAGGSWHRAADRFAVAYLLHGLSPDHRAYLAAGGSGFLLGDGRLRYGPEGILEAYYRAQLGAYVEVSPDAQWIHNPGYNRDRGPAAVVSLRLNLRY